jgi:hypothetical protein
LNIDIKRKRPSSGEINRGKGRKAHIRTAEDRMQEEDDMVLQSIYIIDIYVCLNGCKNDVP